MAQVNDIVSIANWGCFGGKLIQDSKIHRYNEISLYSASRHRELTVLRACILQAIDISRLWNGPFVLVSTHLLFPHLTHNRSAVQISPERAFDLEVIEMSERRPHPLIGILCAFSDAFTHSFSMQKTTSSRQ